MTKDSHSIVSRLLSYKGPIFMPAKRSRLRANNLLVVSLCAAGLFACPTMLRAQSGGASTETEATLFIQSLPARNGQDSIELVWIPEPLQRLCLGKTTQQCANMDYCIRTTNRNVSTCRNLAVPLSRLPSYPVDMTPSRVLSVVLMRLSPDHFTTLQDFFRSAPRASLERLSLSARVKARVRLTSTADDDSMYVLEILAAPL